MAVEFIMQSKDAGWPAGGTEHKPIFIASLLHVVNFALLWNL